MFRFVLHISGITLILIFIETIFLYFSSCQYSDLLESRGFSTGLSPEFMAAIITMTTIVGMTSVGMYNRKYFFHLDETISRAIVILPLVLGALVLLFALRDYALDGPIHTSIYALCAATIATFAPTLIILRKICLDILDRSDGIKPKILVIGTGSRAISLRNLSRELRHRSFTISGYALLTSQNAASEQRPWSNQENAATTDDLGQIISIDSKELLDYCKKSDICEIVVATTERRGMPVRDLLECKIKGVATTDFGTFWERESGQISLEDMSPSWLLFSDGFKLDKGRILIQRMFDILISSILLLVTLPITLLTAILIKLESKGPIFYTQERVGLHGKTFHVVKFRSMRTDAEKDGPRWASKNDTRVTRVGAFIRKVRIDEIPQVINVLKGDMAFVGPRPERPVFVSVLSEQIPYYNIRHAAKPGITGWAQINYPYGATIEDAKMKLAFDLYYVKNGNFFLDILTMLQTVKVLLWNDGAH
ncbi:TIGR03013 family PEP-CTERM/XrtA system glycosyltransferase [Azospirillaceae bacterium]